MDSVSVSVQLLGHVDSAMLLAIVCQAPLSVGFPRQEYWSGLPFPFTGIKPLFPALVGGFFITEPPGKPELDTTEY